MFTKDPSCRILLAGLKVGGIGLNLTMASKVIIVDPWWNNAVEQQGTRRTSSLPVQLCGNANLVQRCVECSELVKKR